MKVTIQNNVSGLSPDDIYVYLTGDSFQGDGITAGTPTKLSDLAASAFNVTQLLGSGRLYISLNAPTATNPVPYGGVYYGYLEFVLGTDGVLWVDLSSVDTFGVPMQFKVNDNNIGYQTSHNDIVSKIQAIPGADKDKITIDCGHGNTKIVGANVYYDDYPSFNTYLDALKGASLKIISVPDSPLTYSFSGTFGNDGGVSLSSGSDTFGITAAQLTSAAVYLCNGDCVWNKTTRSAMSPNDTCAAIYRDIMVGLNEGYFSKVGDNDSSKFSTMTPFQDGNGNQYAKVIFENCQSYGYPFADKNLKTLIQTPVDATTGFTLIILGDGDTSA